jgi:hypothetical protein
MKQRNSDRPKPGSTTAPVTPNATAKGAISNGDQIKVVKAPRNPEPPKDEGHAVFMYCGGYDSAGNEEKGPCAVITHPWEDRRIVDCSALILGCGTKHMVLGLGGEKQADRVLCIAPTKPKDHEIFSAAQWLSAEDYGLTTKQFIMASKNVMWVSTELRGPEFVQYVHRIVNLTSPGYVLIWPVEFYLRGDCHRNAQRLLSQTGFQLLPRFCGHPAGASDNDDDPSESWKK